jgi:hypothetical protein
LRATYALRLLSTLILDNRYLYDISIPAMIGNTL